MTQHGRVMKTVVVDEQTAHAWKGNIESRDRGDEIREVSFFFFCSFCGVLLSVCRWPSLPGEKVHINEPACGGRDSTNRNKVGTTGVFVKSVASHREEARTATTGSGSGCVKLGS